ncbi:sensor histidine kinase [Pseudobacteriovorax antillogorgiicola]|uniref:histidine kinase n=1 Tax=Pseudobacteriovorax antillogorgiicola TaxID=1513793 RepID=A0A1Y6BI84_9BACT|nr:sensor histidine kinase [Pseudobacteriovorax antillogorgiicola]TCS56471.1 signal transduction histidine kinase [Pseudobacteriovorax antillogorgiicola]SMF05082.1 Signal transduction histidine kinase [Pseudobacteriovorax antillogorgiicola]
MRYFLSTLLFSLLSLEVLSASPKPIIDRKLSYEAFVYEDKTGQLTAHDIISGPMTAKFQSLKETGRISYGYTDSVFWLYVDITNDKEYPLHAYIGSLRPDPLVLDMYEVVGDRIIQHRGGTSVPIAERESFRRLHFFEVNIPAKSMQRFYFRTYSSLDMTLDLHLFDENSLLMTQVQLDLTHFAYFGMMTSLVIYSLCLYLFLRRIEYLIYGLFAGSIAVSAFIYSGFLEYWDIQLGPLTSNQQARHAMAISPILTMMYTIQFLNLKSLSKWVFRFAQALLCYCLMVAIYSFIERSPFGALLLVGSQASTMFASFFLACYAVYRGRKSAIYYATGTFIFICTIIIWTLGNQGVIEKSYFVAFTPLFGGALEMLFTMIALSWHFKEYQEYQFAKEMSDAEAANLRTLVQVVCHDIANPLSVIILAKKMAQKLNIEDPKLQKIFENVDRASRSINAIIAQVRRIQSIKSGKFKVTLESVSIKSLFSDVQFNLEQKAKAKGITLTFNLAANSEDDLLALAEPTSLSHDVISNFVSNAIKFSKKGDDIKIRAYMNQGKIILEVIDQGIGIPKNILESIFSPSKATSRPGTEDESGTGFGMPLAKYFIEQYGGTVAVESRDISQHPESHGTTVRTELTAYKAAP